MREANNREDLDSTGELRKSLQALLHAAVFSPSAPKPAHVEDLTLILHI